MARLRVDGFVSLDAGVEEGFVLTRPLDANGRVLHVNADASHGNLQVELVNQAGMPISGYTKDECTPIVGDAIDHEVTWQTHSDLSSATGSSYRLKFHLQNASLYSFKIDFKHQ